MKHLSLLLVPVILFLIYCKPAKKTTVTGSTAPAAATVAPVKTVADLQIEIAQARWPNTMPEELATGKTIYTTKCTECHKNYAISRFSETKWNHEIDDMSPKAKLTAEEKLKLTKYILSYREANEKMTTK